eukprot:1196174-Prorocentrum_minimum.AAC.5
MLTVSTSSLRWRVESTFKALRCARLFKPHEEGAPPNMLFERDASFGYLAHVRGGVAGGGQQLGTVRREGMTECGMCWTDRMV